MLRYRKVTPRLAPTENPLPPARFHTDETIPNSGIYRVIHASHRLPHEVTLLKGQRFPRCQRCAEAVVFEQVTVVTLAEDRRGRIVLHELPEVERRNTPRPKIS